jgi:SAM-dependent methyltransferase
VRSDDRWRERGRLFDRVAGEYKEGRPGYPPEVFEILEMECGLRAGSRVLEIGPGTGQATLPLLERGASVVAVEPGADLADQLRERAEGLPLEIIASAFEPAEVPEAAFDLAVSASAFHWVDPSVGPHKCARAVRDGGWLALWWTVWFDNEKLDPFLDSLRPILEAKAPDLFREGIAPLSHALDVAARTAEIDSTGAFGPVRQHRLRWLGEHDAAGIRSLFATFSPWLALPGPLRHELLDDIEHLATERFDGVVRRPYQTVMYLAQRSAR